MPVMMKRSDMRPGQRFSHEGNLLTVVDDLYEVDESGCRWAFGDTAPVRPFTLAPPRAPAQPLPIVYDPQCPRDYAHEFRGMLVVGDKSKATHEVAAIVGPRGEFVRFEFRSLAAPSVEPDLPKVRNPRGLTWTRELERRSESRRPVEHSPLDAAPPISFKTLGGAVWTGASAEEMIASGRPILPESWTLPARWPAPNYAMWHEPERIEVRYEGSPPSEASEVVGQYPSAMEWAAHDARVARFMGDDDPRSGHIGDAFVYVHKAREAIARARAEWHPPLVTTVAMEARASAEWSAQLRAKVEERRQRDAEAARVTPYWSPEEQSGDDL